MSLVLPMEVPQSLTDIALDRIRAAIIDGTLALGDQISESALAASFGISKTPVREALVGLQREGLVTIQPRRGTFVFTLQEQELAEICDCRTILELAALKMAVEQRHSELSATLGRITASMKAVWVVEDYLSYRRLDSDFHQAFFDHCENRYLVSAYGLISGKMAALRTRLSSNREHVQKSYDEHIALCDLIAKREIEAAILMLEGHIGRRQGSYWITDEAVL
jgi:DNA-binding GntR family transcriptional regulator